MLVFSKVTSSQNIVKWVPNGSPKGPLPWDPLDSQGFPSHGGVWDPLPWDPLGSQGFPLPWTPSYGISLGSQGSHPMGTHLTALSICIWSGRTSIAKELTRDFSARSHICKSCHPSPPHPNPTPPPPIPPQPPLRWPCMSDAPRFLTQRLASPSGPCVTFRLQTRP